jgi:toxin CcdB
MPQFAIYRLRTGDELVCRIQTDLGVATPYVLCAPVVRGDAWGPPVPRLHVALAIDDVAHLLLMTQMVALPAVDLGPVVGSASDRRDAIVRAVDLLVTGF